jgi:SAM-dependent methyltransferase
MHDVFGSTYADFYDLLYHDKDYAAECDMLERLFAAYAAAPVQRVLDLGCGTGSHALPLAQRGYRITGVDRAAPMLAAAREKARAAASTANLVFTQADICSVNLGQQFDAAVMMFAVLGYQRENSAVLAALKSARRHLEPGGLLIFDVWYGPAVLAQKPEQRIKVIPTQRGRLLRVAAGELESAHHITTVSYHLWHLEGERLVAETTETHTMRFFFPLELDLLLEWSGFGRRHLGRLPDTEQPPDEHTWNVICVAQAV